MRKIVDKNFIELGIIEEYLKKDNHFIILTDFFMVETLKGEGFTNLFKTFKIVSKYPNRVLILNSMKKIINIRSLNLSGMQRKLIDHQQSSAFPGFCKILYSNINDAEKIDILGLKEKKTLSNEFINSNIKKIEKIREATYELIKQFSRKELVDFFELDLVSHDFFKKIARHTLILTFKIMERNDVRIDNYSIIKNTYYFRFSLAMTILIMQWIFNSKQVGTKDTKLSNDIMDMSYVALATYFDGVLTNDSNLKYIYKIVNMIISLV